MQNSIIKKAEIMKRKYKGVIPVVAISTAVITVVTILRKILKRTNI